MLNEQRSDIGSISPRTKHRVFLLEDVPSTGYQCRFFTNVAEDVDRPSPNAPEKPHTSTARSTPAPHQYGKVTAVARGSQEPLALTPSFVELPSEMTNYSSNVGQSPTVGRDAVDRALEPDTQDDLSFRSANDSGSSADDASITDAEPVMLEGSPDWTAELVRTTLGTESLFDFLSILDVAKEGATSKSSLVTAFLTLVAVEREKLDLPALPLSCTPASVLASKILPHTTVLGTTSLAAFLAQFEFGGDDTVEAEEIYRIF